MEGDSVQIGTEWENLNIGTLFLGFDCYVVSWRQFVCNVGPPYVSSSNSDSQMLIQYILMQVRHLIYLLCQFVNYIEVMQLPVYHPLDQEKEDPKLYAENVRKLMAHEVLYTYISSSDFFSS